MTLQANALATYKKEAWAVLEENAHPAASTSTREHAGTLAYWVDMVEGGVQVSRR